MHPDLPARPHLAVNDPHEHHHALIGIVPGIEEQRPERTLLLASRRRDHAYDRLQNFAGADPLLSACCDGGLSVQPDHILDLLFRRFDVGVGKIDLVDHRNDLEVMIQRQIGVCQRLGLHALRCVHYQQRAFAGSHTAGDLIGKVHMAGCIDQVQHILDAVKGLVLQPHGVGLDGDAPFALQVHVIEHLGLACRDHFPVRQRAGELEYSVGQG